MDDLIPPVWTWITKNGPYPFSLESFNLTLKDLTVQFVKTLSDDWVLHLLLGLQTDARLYRARKPNRLDQLTAMLDPIGLTAAWEYWPDEFSALVTEADRRGLQWT